MNPVTLSVEQFVASAQVGLSYPEFGGIWKTRYSRAIEEHFGNLRVRGPYLRGQEVPFSCVEPFSLDGDIGPCRIYESIDGHEMRNCGFWELVWALVTARGNRELFSRIAPLVALNAVVKGVFGRGFVCMSGEFFDPVLSVVLEEDIGMKKRGYKFLTVPQDAPELVLERAA